MFIRNILSFLLILLLQSCSSKSFQQNIKIENSSNEFFKKVDSIVVNKMNEYNIPGLSIGIIKYDSLLYNKGFGLKNINKKNKVRENTNFHTASISKLFTAQAIMLLIERNKLTLNTKLLEIIPELNYKDKEIENISVKSLLNHTSGLPDVSDYKWYKNNQSEKSLEEYILNLNLTLISKPNNEYYYSNLGYNLLGYIVERVTKVNFDDFIKIEILNKSKMKNSDFRYFKILDTLKSSPHCKKFITNNIYSREIYPYTREQAPSSTLNSSSIDLSMWMISFLNSLNNKNSIYKEMIKPSFEPYPYIGLGFQLSTLSGYKIVGHYGGDKGYRSYLFMIPSKNIGLVLLANCDYKEDFRQEILHPIAKLMLKNNI